VSGGEFSREALSARLGADAFALAEQAADQAPAPTPGQVERLRLIFAPHVKRLTAKPVARAA
jgi:hypothetical protein